MPTAVSYDDEVSTSCESEASGRGPAELRLQLESLVQQLEVSHPGVAEGPGGGQALAPGEGLADEEAGDEVTGGKDASDRSAGRDKVKDSRI